MGRKHNDVFILGPESLDFEPQDENRAASAARARPEPGATAGSAATGSAPQHGLGHRPLSHRPAATRPNPAAGLVGRREPRAPYIRGTAARATVALAAGACIAIAAARLLSAGGADPERPSTSPAARIAQVAPAISPAPPAPVALPRRHRGAGSRHAIHRASVRIAHRPFRPSEVPPPPVATAPVSPSVEVVQPTAEAFGFER